MRRPAVTHGFSWGTVRLCKTLSPAGLYRANGEAPFMKARKSDIKHVILLLKMHILCEFFSFRGCDPRIMVLY